MRKTTIRRNKKLILLISVVAILILALTAGTTLAWLKASSGPVVNTFTPARVTSQVEESIKDGVKSDVRIKNTSNIDAYIRATVVINWVDKDGNVAAQKPVEGTDYTIKFPKGTKWFTGPGGYYYFPNPVASKASTDVLIDECTAVAGKAPAGYYLSVEIIADAIQSVPDKAVSDAWNVTVADGKIKPSGN